MPQGIPTLGSKVLGTIKPELTDTTLQGETTQWESDAGRVTMADPPPPWEMEDGVFAQSDARRFVSVPENLEVRWINPKVLDAEGWRDWQPVMASDPRFEVRVFTMVSPEGNIRRGGPNGDILAWMYKSWVLARRKQLNEATARLTQDAVNSQERLQEDFKKGKHGPHLKLDSITHPRYTSLDGRSIKD